MGWVQLTKSEKTGSRPLWVYQRNTRDFDYHEGFNRAGRRCPLPDRNPQRERQISEIRFGTRSQSIYDENGDYPYSPFLYHIFDQEIPSDRRDSSSSSSHGCMHSPQCKDHKIRWSTSESDDSDNDDDNDDDNDSDDDDDDDDDNHYDGNNDDNHDDNTNHEDNAGDDDDNDRDNNENHNNNDNSNDNDNDNDNEDNDNIDDDNYDADWDFDWNDNNSEDTTNKNHRGSEIVIENDPDGQNEQDDRNEATCGHLISRLSYNEVEVEGFKYDDALLHLDDKKCGIPSNTLFIDHLNYMSNDYDHVNHDSSFSWTPSYHDGDFENNFDEAYEDYIEDTACYYSGQPIARTHTLNLSNLPIPLDSSNLTNPENNRNNSPDSSLSSLIFDEM